jgi:perosamine synthetase
MRVIPVNSPLITECDAEAVAEALRCGWVSGDGPMVEEFESSFASSCNRRFGIAVSNGTAAMDLLIHSLDIGPGDEIILPTFTIISCVAQILRCGATPVFVDVEPDTWNMKVSEVASRLSQRTAAVVAVHTYGLPVDIDPLISLCEKAGVPLIEDAAESHGLRYKDRPCGSFGLGSSFSFYANKNITTGEGGMILTDNATVAMGLRSLRNLCFDPVQRFVHSDLGWNMRLSSMQCALGISQLRRLNEIVCRRRAIGLKYQDYLSDLNCISLPATRTSYAENDYWVFGLVLKEGGSIRRRLIQDALGARGIGTRPFFYPLHKQPVLRKFGFDGQPCLPTAEHLGDSGFYIPNGLQLSDSDIDYVASHVIEILEQM